MPVAWYRTYTCASGKTGPRVHDDARRVGGPAERRLPADGGQRAASGRPVSRASITADGDISFVGPYQPTTFSFGGYVKGVKPADMAGWDSPIPPKRRSSGRIPMTHEELDMTTTFVAVRRSRRGGRDRLRSTPGRPAGARAAPFALQRRSDHICIVGNTLAERMQYDGWLETMLHARFPKHELVIRNLGFSGDEVATRLRSKNFGTPDEWLSGNAEPIGGYQDNRLDGRQHQGGRHLRVLRLQRVVRAARPGCRPFKKAARRLDHAHARAEVQRQVGAARRPLLADRARGPAQPGSARRP